MGHIRSVSALFETTMATKDRIIDTLGESELLLPEAINHGLAANDRAKYWMSLLQMAKARADHPEEAFSDLRRDREAAGVGEVRFDRVVREAALAKRGLYRIPEAREIGTQLVASLREMLAPVTLAGEIKLEGAAAAAEDCGRRLAVLEAGLKVEGDDEVKGSTIDAATSGDRARGSSR